MRRLSLTRMGQRTGDNVDRSLPGDRCHLSESTECPGILTVYTSRVEGEFRVRFLECNVCGHKPADSKWVTPYC